MDRRIEKTKFAIRKAYFDLLMDNSSEKITISSVARKANIDRKTFYLHYESTDDIMKEFAQDKIDEVIQNLRPHYKTEQPIEILHLFEVLNQILEENIVFFRFIAMNQKYDFFFDRLKELFVSILFKDYKIFFNFTDIEFRIYANYFVSGILSAYMCWIREEQPVPLEDLSQMLGAAAFEGLKSLLPQRL